MAKESNRSLTERLTCRRRTVMGALAAGGTLAAFGTTTAGEHESGNGQVVTQEDDPAEGDDAVDPIFGFAAASFDIEPPVEPDHEVDLLERERGGEMDAFPERYFEPTGLAIEPGETVQFRLESNFHTVTAYHPDVGYEQRVPDGVGPISSPVLWEGSYFLYTFDEPGVYDLACMVHEWAGTVFRVVVGEATGPATEPVPEPEYRERHPDPDDPVPPDWLAAAVLRDPALDPDNIRSQSEVGWDDLDPGSKEFPRLLLTPPTKGNSLIASLSGDQAGVDTSATGSVHVTPVENGLLWHLVLEDAECVTQAHVHEGTRDEDGPVIAPMVEYTDSPDGTGEGDPVSTLPDEPIVEGGVIDDDGVVQDIRANPDDYYVNVHTTHEPAGEIRGQFRGGHPDDIVVREPEPAEFLVSDLDPVDVTVTQGDQIDVSATVQNTGDATETQTVEFRVDGGVEAETELELGCREVQTVTFEGVDTGAFDPGEYEHGVFTEDDDETGTLTIEEEVPDDEPPDDEPDDEPPDDEPDDEPPDDEPDDEPPDDEPDDEPADDEPDDDPDDEPDDEPPDDVDDEPDNDEPDDGEPEFVVSLIEPDMERVDPNGFDVSATIENVGGEAGTQTVTLRIMDDIGGIVVFEAEQTVELEGGESTTVMFEGIDRDDVGSGGKEVEVGTADDSRTTMILVSGAGDPAIIIENMEPNHVTLGMGEDFEVRATFRNLADEPQDTVAELLGPGPTMDGADVDLGPGEAETFELRGFSDYLEPGEHEFFLFIPSDTWYGTMVVEGFAVTDLEPGDVTLSQDDELDVSATIESFGSAATQTIALRVDGEVLDEQELTLDGGASGTVTFEGIDISEFDPGAYSYGVFTEDGSQTVGDVAAVATLTVEEDDEPTDDDDPEPEPDEDDDETEPEDEESEPDDDADDEPDEPEPDDDTDDEPDDDTDEPEPDEDTDDEPDDDTDEPEPDDDPDDDVDDEPDEPEPDDDTDDDPDDDVDDEPDEPEPDDDTDDDPDDDTDDESGGDDPPEDGDS